MKILKTLYMIATVVCIIAATYFLCQKGFAKEDTLAGFACICAAFFFIILFGKICNKIENQNKK